MSKKSSNGDERAEPPPATPATPPRQNVAEQLVELYLAEPYWLRGLAVNLAWLTKHDGAGMPSSAAQMRRRNTWFEFLSSKERAQYLDNATGVAFAVAMGISCRLNIEAPASGPQIWRPGGQA